ncbi:hypothetical protein ACO22_02195 [Paracoccidioides brasiliensis]|uniref:Uncharacterized protein n=1 Tax=Paracoccidioides brasiliensis TaxID=121759 RepID=A0A1D2JJE5_PARBR|nr:hypothetical protein ACO22_02195 [Paracoccidioides brasiliensis]
MSYAFEVRNIHEIACLVRFLYSVFFQHLDVCLPITAIRVLDAPNGRLIISGHGPYLQVVDDATGILLDRVQIFQRNNVHGIQLSNLKPPKPAFYAFFIWGGQSFRLCSLEVDRPESVSLSFLSSECAAPDWILDASFHQPGNDDPNSAIVSGACLITAHNVLFGLNFENGLAKYHAKLHLYEIGTGLKSVLYSADVSWLSPKQVLVAAGTVFGEIVVWSCLLSTDSRLSPFESASVVIHHLFTGHEGSIFGVDISPEITWPNDVQARRFLASCSDDRTIRIWDISDRVYLENGTNEDVSVRPATRSTGFGDIFRDDLEVDPKACIAKAWGHASRIWSACFVDMAISEKTASFKLVSRGEDATCQVWELNLRRSSATEDHQVSYKNAILKNTSIHAYHAGKNIWSMAVHVSSDSTATIYTGGADGSIISFDINTREAPSHCRTHTETYDIYDLSLRQSASLGSPVATPTQKLKSGDKLHRYAFVSGTCIVALSSRGKLNMAFISAPETEEAHTADQGETSVSWETIASLDTPGSQFALAGRPDLGIAIIGDVKGTIWWYRHDNRDLLTFTQLEKKITGIIFASSEPEYGCNMGPITSVAFVTISVEIPSSNLFLISDKNSPQDFTKIALELPSTFMTTSAVLVEHKSHLILGSKTGHLAIFDLERPTKFQSLVPVLIVFNIHARDTVTSITQLQQSIDSGNLILTTGRDGYYCIHALVRTGNANTPLTLQTIHRMAPPFGPYVDGAYFDKTTGDLILFGFKSTDFIIWNESIQAERASIECGGAHRIWAYNSYHADEQHEIFAWTKASSFNLFRKKAVLHHGIKLGNHGREIKVAAVSGAPFEFEGTRHRIIATGGEDTLIRISILDEANVAKPTGAFRCLRNLKKHNAGIQHLQWSPCGKILFSSAGAEEFYVWRLRPIPGFGLGTICEGECPKATADSDLRITSFDLMKVVNGEESVGSFVLCLAYSNSTVKISHYISTDDGGTFSVLANGEYTTNCLTRIKFCRSGSGLSLITASTDGHIATWNLSESLGDLFFLDGNCLKPLSRNQPSSTPHTISWQHRHCMHQSSIKAMEVSPLLQGEYLIVAGGDDNSISISRLSIGGGINSDTATNSFSTVSLPQAHASAVTAISILKRRSRPVAPNGHCCSVFEFLVVSSGNDQRLKLWWVEIDSTKMDKNQIAISLLQDVYTAVADMSSIVTFRKQIDEIEEDECGTLKDRILLCGVGTDLLSLDKQ